MGSPEYAVKPLRELVQEGYEISAVYTRPDKPAGRGRLPVATPVKMAALELNLPLLQEPSLKTPGVLEKLASFKPDAVVVAAFGLLIPQAVLDLPRYGCLNIHPSLLPKYRGAAPIQAAILAGDDFAGVSLMRLDAGWDTGPVYSRAQVGVRFEDTSESLTTKLFDIGSRMLLELLTELPKGRRNPDPQDNSQASYYPEITREMGKIDWSLPATDIWRRVRAYQPWPETYTHWQGKMLKIREAVPLALETGLEAGIVTRLPNDLDISGRAFGVAAGKGTLAVLQVQIEGKRAMPAADFLKGQREFSGSLLD